MPAGTSVSLCYGCATKCKRDEQLAAAGRTRQNAGMTADSFHPAFCSALRDDWLWPQPLPDCRLVSSDFDSALLQPDDFARCGIAPAPGAAKRQSEYLAGRLCARQALRQLTGTATVPACGADRAPQWPAGTVGSITHSAGWAAAVVGPRTRYQGLGLDAERLLSSARAQRLATEILSPGERLQAATLDPEAHALLVSLTFSLKESLFKALYPLVQRRFYFQDAELLNHDPAGTAELQLLRSLSPAWPGGSRCTAQFVLHAGYVLSLVSISV